VVLWEVVESAVSGDALTGARQSTEKVTVYWGLHRGDCAVAYLECAFACSPVKRWLLAMLDNLHQDLWSSPARSHDCPARGCGAAARF
jgi:hypothetical protein